MPDMSGSMSGTPMNVAATLGIGVLISLFTSLNCSKTFLRFLTSYQSMRQKNLYLINDKNLINQNISSSNKL